MHIARIVKGMPTSDGAGVRLTRMIGTPQLDLIDPFLMLDRFDAEDPNAYIAGFPDHPHRGFETVTLMLDGRLRHKDSTGSEGVIEPGGVQWMTAGRGIIHSEMPEQEEGRMRGFQLWVNLPAAQKMVPPGYQDITPDMIPVVTEDGRRVHVVAGRYGDVEGPAKARTPIRILRIELDPGASMLFDPPEGHNAFVCVYEGAASGPDSLGRELTIPSPSLALLHGAGGLSLVAGDKGAAIYYGEGEPIGEPVARYGPFVMNTEQELIQAVRDFQSGKFGR